jgi:hypothetical protein
VNATLAQPSRDAASAIAAGEAVAEEIPTASREVGA